MSESRDFSNYWNALTFAFRKYGNLKRDSISYPYKIPYVVHPIRITSILRAYGFNEFENEDLLISALFHDLIEDTDTALEEIEKEFGSNIASIVNELTKPENIKKENWLESFKDFSKEAKIIKIADRIDNLLDMDTWSNERKAYYTEQSKIILNSCGDAHEGLTKRLKELIFIKE